MEFSSRKSLHRPPLLREEGRDNTAVAVGSALRGESPSTATTAKESAVKSLGLNEGPKITGTFVFVDGRCLDAPYVVSRRGLDVLINGVAVWRSDRPWPIPDLRVESDPGSPAEAYANAKGVEDLCDEREPWKSHYMRKVRYLWQHYPPGVAQARQIEYIREIPFVASAEPVPGLPTWLRILTKDGRVQSLGVAKPDASAISFTKENLIGEIEGAREYIEGLLLSGEVAFVFPSVKDHYLHHLSQKQSARALPVVVQVLRSSRPEEEKLSLLAKAGFCPPVSNPTMGAMIQLRPEEQRLLVRQFEASSELERRLDALVREAGVRPLSMTDLLGPTRSME